MAANELSDESLRSLDEAIQHMEQEGLQRVSTLEEPQVFPVVAMAVRFVVQFAVRTGFCPFVGEELEKLGEEDLSPDDLTLNQLKAVRTALRRST